MTILVTTFYKFVAIDDPPALQAALAAEARTRTLRGTILIATEGINATLAGAPDDIVAFMTGLRADARFSDLTSKEVPASAPPFRRLKVKVKPEIVTLGASEAKPAERVGTYVRPADWNALISEPGVMVLDTRNAYEIAFGRFAHALDPGTQTFSQFRAFARTRLDPARDPKIAMYCTGGIRCEKASAYLLALGFSNVYQLDGGILGYLAAIPPDQSLWHGRCFVFDERGAVGEGLEQDAAIEATS